MDFQLLLILIGGHYLADFALQTDFMNDMKRQAFINPYGFHVLTAHSFIQGLVIGLLAQSFSAGLIVGATHWFIDFFKGSQLLDDRFPHTRGARQNGQKYGLYGIHLDQLLHISVIFLVVLFVL